MKPVLSALLLLPLLLLVIACEESPVCPEEQHVDTTNLIANPTFFTTNEFGQNLDNETAFPWRPAYGSPQHGAGVGCDSTHGFVQMWGNSTGGEAILQTLAAPIRKGKTYRVSVCMRFVRDNPNMRATTARLRFVGYNQAPNGIDRWADNAPGLAVIGAVETASQTWVTLESGRWTADADYSGFAINVENDLSGSNSESWAHVDNVTLREVAE